ncbi:MAG: hypothetical protein R6T99_05440 [Bacteroidales bacterium]
MKKNYHSFMKFLAVLLLGVIPIFAIAQDTEDGKSEKSDAFARHLYGNINAGVSLGHADIAENKWISPTESWRLGYGANLGWQVLPFASIRGQIANARIFGEQDKVAQWNYKDVFYDAEILDYHLAATLSFTNLIFGYKERFIDFYGIVGIGQANFKTELINKANGVALARNGYDNNNQLGPTGDGDDAGINDRTMVLSVPAGVGFAFRVAKRWDITLESQWKWLDTERLDGTVVPRDYPVKQDMHSYTAMGVKYKFAFGGGIKKMEKDFDKVEITATPDPLEVHGDSVEVTVKGTIPEKYFDKDAAMYLEPKIKHAGGEIPLEPLTLKGEDVTGEGTMINYKSGGSFSYTQKVPYEPEMNVSDLVVDPVIYVAKEKTYDSRDEIMAQANYVELPQQKLADGVVYTSRKVMDDEIVLYAHHGYEKETVHTKKAKIFFFINRYDLNWRVPLNKKDATKQKLQELKDFLARGWEIKDIQIDGWASPEGEETFNNDLSENRAHTAYKYMVREIKKLMKKESSRLELEDPEEDINFIEKWHGPDWEGFLANVQESSIKDKNAILNVIRSAGQEKREEEIRNMILIYPELEENLLPPLRRAIITVNLYEPKRPDEQIKDYATQYPDSLEVDEMLYAATMHEDNETKVMIYKSVTVQFPDNWLGYNNAGAMEIELGNLSSANDLLSKADEMQPNNGIVKNNLGVLACHRGEYDKAEMLFREAQKLGEGVDYNLGVMEILNGNYGRAVQLFGNTKCKYNVGLAQLLNGDESAAENTFKCAPGSADSYYMLAVIGARTNNSSLMYEYLGKAIEEDPGMKNVVRNDREFIDYYNAPDFQALIK